MSSSTHDIANAIGPIDARGRLTLDEVLALSERHLALLREFVRKRSGPVVRAKEAVSDVVQSTLRELVEAREGLVFRDEAAFRSWFYTAATRKIIDKHRHHAAQMRNVAREEELPEDLPDPLDASALSRSPARQAIRKEEIELLALALEHLDERDRQILVLRKVFDVPASKIGAELGIAESTVNWRLRVVMTELASKFR